VKSTGQVLRPPWAFGLLVAGLLAGPWLIIPSSAGEGLPVDAARAAQKPEVAHYGVRNALTLPQLWAAVKGGKEGLTVDLSHVRELADGTTIDPAMLYGTACFGPYPFEAAETPYAYKRFRFRAAIVKGKTTLKVGKLLITKHNSEEWTDTGQIAVRIELHLERPGRDRALGVYDTFAAFKTTPQGVVKLPSIVEGPLVNLVTSDDPTTAVISYVTDQAVAAAAVLDDGRRLQRVGAGKFGRNRQIQLVELPGVDVQLEVDTRLPILAVEPDGRDLLGPNLGPVGRDVQGPAEGARARVAKGIDRLSKPAVTLAGRQGRLFQPFGCEHLDLHVGFAKQGDRALIARLGRIARRIERADSQKANRGQRHPFCAGHQDAASHGKHLSAGNRPIQEDRDRSFGRRPPSLDFLFPVDS